MVSALVIDALDEDFGVSTGIGEYAVRPRRGRRAGTPLCSRSRPLLLRLVSFECSFSFISHLWCLLLVFSRRHRHSTPHQPWSGRTPPSLRLSPSLSQCTHLHPRHSLPHHGLNPHRLVHSHRHLVLVGRRCSRQYPPYLVPFSHHLLQRRLLLCPLQGKSPYPPLSPPETTSPNLDLFNQVIRGWFNLR